MPRALLPRGDTDDGAIGTHDCNSLECDMTHGNEIALIQRWEEGLVSTHRDTGCCLLPRVAGTNCLTRAEYLGMLGHGDCGRGGRGDTAGHIAARARNARMVKILVVLAPVDGHGKFGEPVLHIAAELADAAILEVLLDAGAAVDCRDAENSTALHVETAKGHLKGIALLLQAGANVDAQNTDGKTALRPAIDTKSVEMARILLQAGADVNAKDVVGNTSLHLAATEDEEMIVDLLFRMEPMSPHPTAVGTRRSIMWS